MVTGRYSRLLRSGTDEMTHFHTKRNRRKIRNQTILTQVQCHEQLCHLNRPVYSGSQLASG